MTINWIKSSEQMPPDDDSLFIIEHPNGGYLRVTGALINHLKNQVLEDIEYTAYTPEAWEEMNR